MDKNKEIGVRIRQRRTELNMTQEELGNKLGLNKSTIQRYESGSIASIKLPVLQSIAKQLNVNPDWLALKTNEIGTYHHDRSILAENEGLQIEESKKDIAMYRIERARSNMTQQERDKMMKILEASFEEYFTDNYIDTTDYSDEDED